MRYKLMLFPVSELPRTLVDTFDDFKKATDLAEIHANRPEIAKVEVQNADDDSDSPEVLAVAVSDQPKVAKVHPDSKKRKYPRLGYVTSEQLQQHKDAGQMSHFWIFYATRGHYKELRCKICFKIIRVSDKGNIIYD